MPGPPQARVVDVHICPLTMGVPAPFQPPCCPTVLVNRMPASRATDMLLGMSPHPLAKGSVTVFIGKLPAARLGMDLCSAGGAITLGSFNVFTGG